MIAYGASPRATLGLVAAGRALALIRGRTYVLPQDVYDIAPEVLRHRLVLSYEALADGVEADDLVNRIITAIQLPADRPEPGAGSGNATSRSHRQRPARGRRRTKTSALHEQRHASAPRVESTLRRLELDVFRRLDGLLQGDHLGLVPAPGTEAGESREYQVGDDVRRMDWPVTARTQVPHVRDTIADRELETWIVVDRSASLDFGTAQFEKRDLALAMVAAVGFLTSRSGNRVGALVLGNDRTFFVPGARWSRGDVRAVAPDRRRPAPRRRPAARRATCAARCARWPSSRAAAVSWWSSPTSSPTPSGSLPCERWRSATTCSRSRSSTRARSSSRRWASSPSSTPKPAAGWKCRPRARRSVPASPRPPRANVPALRATSAARAPSTSCCAPTVTGSSISAKYVITRKRRRAARVVPK